VCFPSIAKALQKSKGKLTIPALIRVLKALKHPKVIDLALIGVVEDYKMKGASSIILNYLIEIMKREKIEYCETNLTLEENKNIMSLYQENKDTQVKAVLSVEGGSACGGTIEGLYHLYNRGVRVITLTWNDRNEIAGGAFSDGGFTGFGKDFVKVCEELGIIIDVSHLNRESFFQLSDFSQKPFIASHSNPDIVSTNSGRKRNLTDEQIEIIKKRGGLIGINLYKDFLDIENKSGVEALKVHLDYLLERGCESVIAFGGDFDGCDLTEGISGIESIEEVYNSLLESGYNEELVDNLFYNNANLFFKNVIQ
jgi:membrane dipeptidase